MVPASGLTLKHATSYHLDEYNDIGLGYPEMKFERVKYKMCTWVGSPCEGVGGGAAQRQTISSCPDSSQWTAASKSARG